MFLRSFFKAFLGLALFIIFPEAAEPVCRISTPLAPGYYVAPTGSDANNPSNTPGTPSFSAPFATLTRCQTAMRSSATAKFCYVRGGNYAPSLVSGCDGGPNTCALDLQHADDGVTYQYYPPDGYGSAIITGGSVGVGTGAFYLINIHGDNITINGLTLKSAQYAIIGVTGGSINGMMITNNTIFNQYTLMSVTPGAGAIQCYGCANATISHNYIHDTASAGVIFSNVNGLVTNMTVDSNFIQSTCTGVADCGAVYLVDSAQTSTGTKWINNYIRDGNTFATLGTSGDLGSAFYNDDCAGNTTITGNVVTGRNGSNGAEIMHGGHGIHFNNNLVDISTFQQQFVTFQGLPSCADTTMSDDQVENNIFIGTGPGNGYRLLSGTPSSTPIIVNNDYFPYGAGAVVNHVVLVLEENQDYNSVVGNGCCPYFNSLANTYGLATQYYGDAHPSMGNYFMLTSGLIISTSDAYDPGSGGNTSDNIVRHILGVGKTWKEYCENRPSIGYTGNDVYPFIQHHCPLGYYSDVRGSQTQLNNLVGFPQFTADVNNNVLPTYSFVAPNQLNNAHDGSLATADSWLQTNIKPLIDNTARMSDTIVFILFDEATGGDSTHGGGRIYWTAIGPSVKSAYQSTFSFYQHESTARTSLERLGLPINMNGAATAPSMNEFFVTSSAFSTSGSGGTDTNPSVLDPQLSCWTYNVAVGSPVLSTPVSFLDICRTWGPPGFVVPHTGTVPTSPHTC